MPPMAGKEKTTPPAPEGERLAKVLSRHGVASRREAEKLIEAGEVKVNGKTVASPALNVTPADRITISGHPLPEREPARLWLYYKPEGLVTSEADEKGRDTVFDNLPGELPRVMSVGRLDLNSEGLLLLTNDGELKRRLELPSTGWLRKYRVRVNGNPTDPDLEPLRRGITVDGERFQPMQVVLDRVQGANAWLTVGLREGKNREIRRAMNEIGLYVNRLIRVSYGPFRLGELKPGEVEEVRQKVLREQLGEGGPTEPEDKPARRAPAKASAHPARPAGGKLPAGEGLRQLSSAWKEATRPRDGAKPAARARPEGESRPTRGATSGTSSGTGRPPRDETAPRGAKPAHRSRGAAAETSGASHRARPAPDADRGPSRTGERPPRGPAGAKPAPRSRAGEDTATGTRPPRSAAAGTKPASRTTTAADPSTSLRKPRGGAPAGKPAKPRTPTRNAPAKPTGPRPPRKG